MDGDGAARPDTGDAVLGVNRAQNWDEFRAALSDFGAPSQTFLYADVDGNIGVQIPGAIPIRASGDGAYPVSGEDGAHDWTGYVPFDQMPYVYNPSSGSSSRPTTSPWRWTRRCSWAVSLIPGWRAARIHELLDTGEADHGPTRCAPSRATSS